MDWRRYRKAIVASGGATVLVGLNTLYATGVLRSYPWLDAAVAVFTAMGVYQIPNVPMPQPPYRRY